MVGVAGQVFFERVVGVQVNSLSLPQLVHFALQLSSFSFSRSARGRYTVKVIRVCQCFWTLWCFTLFTWSQPMCPH
jgi:hypothetical protein